ncbi:GntR family transcriptional regulator [Sphaerochaeta globosa]|uniref:Transcriptional regulator, GntR family n=1 Tax=Sphaerochaeta globosa (strain ATCC BAA-1886 / DSM 22777 / Buddy) TaxID=158189 RepID=F0RT31_SPHGB|nr:GntR family transcriptional regulator [Sphaerochaeta globosa]ADY14475.1 transcriptional regulator, GntR family [Sphaerochaeta globosa str. Buddy]
MDDTSRKVCDQAYANIKKKILDFEYKPGESIAETTLSASLGISRTPIREALRRLEQDGLLENKNGRKKVTIITVDDLQQIFELKIAIEGMVMRNCAETRTEKDISKLRKAIKQMTDLEDKARNGFTKNLFNEWGEVNAAFHSLTYKIANNSRAEAIINNLNMQWHRWRVGITAMEWRLERNISEHIQFCEAIIEGDGGKAFQLMEKHTKDLFNTVVNIIKTFSLD